MTVCSPTNGAASQLWRLLAAVGVFTVLGPPLGGLVAWAVMGAAVRSPLPFLAGAYAEGVDLAMAAGALVGVAALWFGQALWVVPVMVAVFINAVMLAVNAMTEQVRPDLVTGSLRLAGAFFLPSLIEAVSCWWLTRPLLRPSSDSAWRN